MLLGIDRLNLGIVLSSSYMCNEQQPSRDIPGYIVGAQGIWDDVYVPTTTRSELSPPVLEGKLLPFHIHCRVHHRLPFMLSYLFESERRTFPQQGVRMKLLQYNRRDGRCALADLFEYVSTRTTFDLCLIC